MRILKYILLIVVLFFIGLIVFVATQKADYNITRSKVIKKPRAIIYNFVNDFKNWETFDSRFATDKSIVFNYPELTLGKGASFSWKGDDDEGKLKTNLVKENVTITQDQVLNGENSKVSWQFKDTLGGTKVTWKSSGKLDFKSKVASFFNGGINAFVGNEYERSLENLAKTLDYELKTFSIKENGVVNRKPTFYLKQSVLCREKSIAKNIGIIIPRLEKFFSKNKIDSNGKPFVIYTKYDRINDLVDLSVCIPVKDSIFISKGSDVQSGKLPYYTAIKATLTGDYSHLQKAWNKAYQYGDKKTFIRNANLQIVEVYSKTRSDIKNPSKWITEVYVPVYPKVVATKPVVAKPKDSTEAKPVDVVVEP